MAYTITTTSGVQIATIQDGTINSTTQNAGTYTNVIIDQGTINGVTLSNITYGGLGTMSTQNANNVTITGGTINSLYVTSMGTNSYGTKTVSSSTPSGGNDGDVWYQI